jgi:hypothetical protein
MDTFSKVHWFIDLHSYAGDVLYSWGSDENQSKTSTMNFLNSAYNSVRGILSDTPGTNGGYGEYTPAAENTDNIKAATRIGSAMSTTAGRTYSVIPAAGLYQLRGRAMITRTRVTLPILPRTSSMDIRSSLALETQLPRARSTRLKRSTIRILRRLEPGSWSCSWRPQRLALAKRRLARQSEEVEGNFVGFVSCTVGTLLLISDLNISYNLSIT